MGVQRGGPREQADTVAPQDLKLDKLQMVELTFAETRPQHLWWEP